MSAPGRFIVSPLELVGCALWLDASDLSAITKDGSNLVSQWSDKSGNSKHATQATPANQPTYSATGYNGMPCLDWGASPAAAMGLNTPAISYGAFTAFFVIDGIAGGGYLLGHVSSGANQDYVYKQTASFYVARASVASGRNVAGGTSWIAGKKVLTRRFDGLHTGNVARGNGLFFDPSTVVGGSSDPGTAAVSAVVGIGNSGGSEAWRGKIAEVILFNRALTDGELLQVERYLNRKWVTQMTVERAIASPTDIPNCAIWLDAALGITQSGGLVSQWNDQSGNANHFTASGSGRPTASTLNGFPIVSFDGSDDNMVATSHIVDNVTGSTIVAVCRKRSAAVGASKGVLVTQANALYLDAGAGLSWGGYNGGFKRAEEQPTTNVRVFSARRGLSSVVGQYRLRANGTQKAVLSTGGNDSRVTTELSVATQNPDMDVLALVVYLRSLSDGELTLLENHFNQKYKIYPARLIGSPLDIPDCALWLDATDSSFTKDGSNNVSQWNDLSGNARHATNGTGNATRPIYLPTAVAGKPGVQFLNASDSFLDLPVGVVPSGDSEHTAFLVGQRIAGSGAGVLAWLRLSSTTGVRTNSVIGANNTTGASYFGTSGVGTPVGDVMALGSPYVMTKRYRISTKQAANAEGWLGSTGRAVDTSQMTLGNTAGWLGCSVSTASANFYVAAVVVYGRALSDGELAVVEQFLANKYRL